MALIIQASGGLARSADTIDECPGKFVHLGAGLRNKLGPDFALQTPRCTVIVPVSSYCDPLQPFASDDGELKMVCYQAPARCQSRPFGASSTVTNMTYV